MTFSEAQTTSQLMFDELEQHAKGFRKALTAWRKNPNLDTQAKLERRGGTNLVFRNSGGAQVFRDWYNDRSQIPRRFLQPRKQIIIARARFYGAGCDSGAI